MHRAALLALLGLAVAIPASAQQDVSAGVIRAQQVAESVYMLTGSGSNIAVSAGSDGVVLVDDDHTPPTDEVVAAIRSFSSEPARFVLGTHWHQDATTGNERVGGTGALVVARDGSRTRMSVTQVLGLERRSANALSSPAAALPVVTFAEDITLRLNGDDVRVFRVANAHTAGDALVHFVNANVVDMGEIFVRGGFPHIDAEGGGSIDGMIKAVEMALQSIAPDTKVIPGHGELATRADVVDYLDALRGMRNAVAELTLEGHPIDHILDFRPLQDQAAAWGLDRSAEDAFVETIYAGLPLR